MSIVQNWILDAPTEWTQPRGLALVGAEKVPGGWQDQEGLDLGEILTLFGTSNAAHARVSWSWRTDAWGEVPDLAGVFLVETSLGAHNRPNDTDQGPVYSPDGGAVGVATFATTDSAMAPPADVIKESHDRVLGGGPHGGPGNVTLPTRSPVTLTIDATAVTGPHNLVLVGSTATLSVPTGKSQVVRLDAATRNWRACGAAA